MIPRRFLTILVFALPVLVVAFGVLSAGALLARAFGDALGARVLVWIAMGILMLMAGDIILLVGALGVRALGDHEDRSDSSSG